MSAIRAIALLHVSLAAALFAQTPALKTAPSQIDTFDQLTRSDLAAQAAALKAQAQASPSGLGTETLHKYPGHLTMLTVRTHSGGAEEHLHQADLFVALDGEATVLVGGTIEDRKETAPGELRGTRVIGAAEHTMHQGDVIHIAPGVPHQTVLAPGQTFTYFVIKVDQ